MELKAEKGKTNKNQRNTEGFGMKRSNCSYFLQNWS